MGETETLLAGEAPAVCALRTTLIFVRHGETDWNVAGRLQGQRDIPLNARGRDQAAAVGRTLSKRLGAQELACRDFVCSPMERCRETMEILRGSAGLPAKGYAFDERLKELTFGTWEGFTWREVKARFADGAKEREADKWGFTPPEGESYAALCARIAPWINGLTRETIAVSHGGVMRAAMHLIAGLDPAQASVAEITQGRALLFERGRMAWI